MAYKGGTLRDQEFKSNDDLKTVFEARKLDTSKIKLASDKENVALLVDSSMNPLTLGHLSMLTKAKLGLEAQGELHVAGGYLSPANDGYGKPGLLPAFHRANMLRRTVAESDWMMADLWDCT